jgi:hypothetical protein
LIEIGRRETRRSRLGSAAPSRGRAPFARNP